MIDTEPYTQSQQNLLNELEQVSSYDGYPISFNVKMPYTVRTDLQETYRRLTNPPPLYDNLEWDENQVYDWVLICMRDNLVRPYSDYYRTPAEEFSANQTPNKVEFTFEGRQGGHLCIHSFNGVTLYRKYPDDLAEYSDEFCRDLTAMIKTWRAIFTRQNLAKWFHQGVEDELEQKLLDEQQKRDLARVEADETLYWESRDIVTKGENYGTNNIPQLRLRHHNGGR